MIYNINPEIWRGVFAVPTELVDKQIRLAGALQLKVMLYILRHSGEEISTNNISNALGFAIQDVTDALIYWSDNGFIFSGDAPKSGAFIPSSTIPEKLKPEVEEVPRSIIQAPPPRIKPTVQDIARRAGEAPELKLLFTQAQVRFGRTLSISEQSMLLWIYDYCALPIEVILMLLEFESFEKRLSMSNVEKTARRWTELQIDTIEKAEEFIDRAKLSSRRWKAVASMFGTGGRRPTKREEAYIETWFGEWRFSEAMILEAYEENLDHTAKLSFQYINAVLKRWHTIGISTPEAVQKAKNAHNEKTAEKKKKAENKETQATPSYDINAYKAVNDSEILKQKYTDLNNIEWHPED